jgi:DNA polymerase III subunit delta
LAVAAPVIYLFIGEDEYAIAQQLANLQARLGDPSLVAMNLSRLDGRSYEPASLLATASAMPFLAKRRLVILEHPLARLNTPEAKQKFLETLEKIPETTALALVEYHTLTSDKDRKDGKIHWLEKWALQAGKERALVIPCAMPKDTVSLINDRTQKAGGKFTPQAARMLADLVGNEPRLADQEIHKLLAYVNYQRPVEVEDVQRLTADTAEGDIFKMVDALGSRDSKAAMSMLQRLLEQEDPAYIFSMVVRQFRLLIQAREALDQQKGSADFARQARLHPFVAEKVAAQARYFSLPDLEAIYRHLLDVDEAVKSSKIALDLALELFVATFTDQPKVT